MDYSPGFLKAKLLFKLTRHRVWGEKHTAFDNLKKGFKSNEHHAVIKIAEGLMKENWLLKKPTGYGLHVSLNPDFSKEIKNFVRTYFSDFLE